MRNSRSAITRLFAGALLGALVALAAFTLPPTDPPASSDVLPIEAGTYMIDRDHTEIGFRVRHLGISSVSGQFREYDATLDFDPSQPNALQTTATIQTASVDTRNDKRDEHLRSEDFFHSEAHLAITFRSTGVRNVRGDRFELLGDLTIRGVTKPVALDAVLVGTARGPMGNERVAFTAETTINREDYGLTWNRAVEAGGLVVGKDVDIRLDVQAIRQN